MFVFKMFVNVFTTVLLCFLCFKCVENSSGCRADRSNSLRQDGGLCFEIPPWQHKPVEVEHHLLRIRDIFGNSTFERRQTRRPKLSLVNSEVNRYMDSVIAPFLDTYHRNIQSSFQQLANKILVKVKDEINAAIIKKQTIYNELTQLADSLHLPAQCAEERRDIRTLASKHVSLVYRCTEQARSSIAKMGKYAEETISITKNHMQTALDDAVNNFQKEKPHMVNVTECLKVLSKAAVALGYELDLSLTNARRHNEQSCEKLVNCSLKAKKSTEEAVQRLREFLYQCVYA